MPKLFDEIIALGRDPCGEHGEFHSFVFDGALFRQPVSFEKREERANYWWQFCTPATDISDLNSHYICLASGNGIWSDHMGQTLE
jgi:diphthamide synthase (EF-2-diphthine--ammonia ligase)